MPPRSEEMYSWRFPLLISLSLKITEAGKGQVLRQATAGVETLAGCVQIKCISRSLQYSLYQDCDFSRLIPPLARVAVCLFRLGVCLRVSW
eukprot:2350973-Rhodomonas_salina.1